MYPQSKTTVQWGFLLWELLRWYSQVIGIPDRQRGTTHLVDPARVASISLSFFLSFLGFTNLPMASIRVPEGKGGWKTRNSRL